MRKNIEAAIRVSKIDDDNFLGFVSFGKDEQLILATDYIQALEEGVQAIKSFLTKSSLSKKETEKQP